MASFIRDYWFKKNIWQVIFILIIVYAISSINVLVLVLSVLPFLHGAFFKTHILMYFAEISFGLALFLGVYHVSTIFYPKKRKGDRPEEED